MRALRSPSLSRPHLRRSVAKRRRRTFASGVKLQSMNSARKPEPRVPSKAVDRSCLPFIEKFQLPDSKSVLQKRGDERARAFIPSLSRKIARLQSFLTPPVERSSAIAISSKSRLPRLRCAGGATSRARVIRARIDAIRPLTSQVSPGLAFGTASVFQLGAIGRRIPSTPTRHIDRQRRNRICALTASRCPPEYSKAPSPRIKCVPRRIHRERACRLL